MSIIKKVTQAFALSVALHGFGVLESVAEMSPSREEVEAISLDHESQVKLLQHQGNMSREDLEILLKLRIYYKQEISRRERDQEDLGPMRRDQSFLEEELEKEFTRSKN